MSGKSFANTLSWKITGIVSAIFLVVLLVVAIVSHQIIVDEATRGTESILHGTISEIEKPLGEVEISTQTVAAYMASMKDQKEVLQTIADRTVEISDLINGCAILFLDAKGHCDPNANSVFSYIDSVGVHQFHPNEEQLLHLEELWVKEVLDSKTPCWTSPYESMDSRSTSIATYCYPLIDEALNVYAVVTSDLSVEWIETMMEDIKPYPNSLTTVVCDEQTIIGLKDSTLVNNYKESFQNDQGFRALWEDMKLNRDSVRRKIGTDRNMSFVVYGSLHNGWKLSIICPYHDVLHRAFKMNLYLLLIGIVGLVILFFACRHAIYRLTRPITELSESALAMAKGDFNAKLPEIHSDDEMMHLRDSFQFMQNSIAEYIDELKTTTSANERMESELNVARNIQLGMLRKDFPPQLYAMLTPAKKVGGDLYDFGIQGDMLYFSVGDVSGKGVPASLMMAITRAVLRFVAGLDLPMNESINRLNNNVCEANSNYMFVTLFAGRVNLKTGHMDFCNAGHNPILILPPDGEPYFLRAKTNIAIGLVDDFSFEIEDLDLKPGTRIVAYTDGVNEAEREDFSLFGNERLLQWAKDLAAKTDKEAWDEEAVVKDLYDTVKDFVGSNPQNDDITILSLKV